MKKKPEKMFIVRKRIKAVSALDAIRLDKKTPVDDVWVDENWSRENEREDSSRSLGFKKNGSE